MRLRSMQSILMPIARDMDANDAKQLLQCSRFMSEFFEKLLQRRAALRIQN